MCRVAVKQEEIDLQTHSEEQESITFFPMSAGGSARRSGNEN